jgi:ABC-type amino acid transport substrate-binding protein
VTAPAARWPRRALRTLRRDYLPNEAVARRTTTRTLESDTDFKGGRDANASLGHGCDTWTGKLRAGLVLGGATSVFRDPACGEVKGLAFDLGKELARRMGVSFDPVLYPSLGAFSRVSIPAIGILPSF